MTIGKEDLAAAVGGCGIAFVLLVRGGEDVVEVQHGEHGAATSLLSLASGDLIEREKNSNYSTPCVQKNIALINFEKCIFLLKITLVKVFE